MPTCPRCNATHVILSLDAASSARCLVCGTRWIQDGSEVRRVVGPAVLHLHDEPAPTAVQEP